MEKNVLVMIPGPTPVVESIREQMARPIQAFGDPRFVADYKELITELGSLLNCSGMTFPLAGTGTLAMEMAIANTTKRGDNVLIVSNGFFGDRFIEICERKGLNVDVLSAEWGTIVTPEQIDKKLSEKDYAVVTVSHVDTSTAVVAPLADIGKVMAKHPNTLYIVDGVAATAGEYENVDEMGIDVLFTGSQKAFGVCSGMFVVWASKKALQRRKDLGTIPEYYVDFEKWIPIMENPAKYFATPAVNLVWAMLEATKIIKEEGLKARAERHTKNAAAMHKALESIGLRILADAGCRASTLSCVIYPEGVDDAKFRAAMLDEGVVIAGALGAYAGKAFRIGHMGNATENDMIVALSAVERSLKACGANVELGKAVGTYIAEMKK
ncbi:MAG TPA: alanine--glyoxylate aminotransferase family protein [Candidatus Ventrousia excrementavium]|uniref:Alanine--glyoxylate aminotransferase family protein n=1 Tax=Candidatus Ventrousia excrementavium TaxID=2840961 RepID=A0A9D1LKE4_9CLOT|nr:alanine--glyoxylate aminotransferase family protein [Candidatus Ventrousia excrementavium]